MSWQPAKCGRHLHRLPGAATTFGRLLGWLDECKAELWYVERARPPWRATAFCLGALRAALWLLGLHGTA